MQALILATDDAPPRSRGEQNPLTERIPTPLLPVLNRPIMAYTLELLVRAGVRDIGVAVYRNAGSIEAHFAGGAGYGAQLTYFVQREPLGSAGSLRWAASGLKERLPQQGFVVLPGDAIADFDICAALEFHKSHRGAATVVAHAAQSAQPHRPVAVARGRVSGLSAEAEPGSALLAATGAYIFAPSVLDLIPPRRAFDCYADLLPELLARGDVRAYVADGYWRPVDSVRAYHQAQMDALASATGAAGSAATVRYVATQDKEIAPGVLAARRASVHPAAKLVAPVYIGAGAQIGRDAEIGPNAVIGPNSIVDEGATVRDSTVLEGTYVGRLLKVDGRVVRGALVVDAETGDSLRVVDPFLLGEVSTRLIAGPAARLLARAADVMAALLLLLLALPVLALTAFALLPASLFAGAPGVLALQPRVRWRRTAEAVTERETYAVPHFRTRRAGGRYAPLGAFLERAQLDHLPALASVLTGDLRLVGVKPLAPAEAERLTEEWQRLPYEGTAGFTGLWYVAASGGDLDEIVATDAYYTATRSFGEDLRLLLLTPVTWVRGRAARPARAQGDRLRRSRGRARTPAAREQRSLPPMRKDAAKQAGD